VYRPRESITPQVARHFTPLVEPPTVAVNVVDSDAFIVIDPGDTVTETERFFEGRESFNGAAAAKPATLKHTHAGTMIFFFKNGLSGDRLGVALRRGRSAAATRIAREIPQGRAVKWCVISSGMAPRKRRNSVGAITKSGQRAQFCGAVLPAA
jgi:hypothetical protein